MDKVINFRSVYNAYRACRRRKRCTANAQRYDMHLLDNLHHTLVALQTRSYQPRRSMRFVAQKPKAREIHAADFYDRVVHHWLIPQLEPYFEPVFIHDVYSNRVGKGTHGAVDRLQSFMHAVGNQGYYLQLDIANFFNSVDKAILFSLLQQRLRKCLTPNNREQLIVLRWLCYQLLKKDSSKQAVYRGNPALLKSVPPHKLLANAGHNKGLPIGNLTSQFFANVYLNPLDQFIKHTLKCRYYLRYVDDFILLAPSAAVLLEWRAAIVQFLADQLALTLKLNQGKYTRSREHLPEPKPVNNGADFLGYITYPHHRLVRRRVVGNLREKLQGFQRLMLKGRVQQGYTLILLPEALIALQAVLSSYKGHFKHADTYRLQAQLWQEFAWLALLFMDASPGKKKYEPLLANITSYRSQIRFFHQHYPDAELHCQRGTEVDRIPAPHNRSRPDQSPVIQVDIREQGYLKGGLKRRMAYRLLIKPGVELCTHHY